MSYIIKLRDLIDLDSDTIMTNAEDINLFGDNMIAFSNKSVVEFIIPINSILFIHRVDSEGSNYKQLSFDSLGDWLN